MESFEKMQRELEDHQNRFNDLKRRIQREWSAVLETYAEIVDLKVANDALYGHFEYELGEVRSGSRPNDPRPEIRLLPSIKLQSLGIHLQDLRSIAGKRGIRIPVGTPSTDTPERDRPFAGSYSGG